MSKRLQELMQKQGHAPGDVVINKDVSVAKCVVCGAYGIESVAGIFGVAIDHPCDRSMANKTLMFEPWTDADIKARQERSK